MSAPKLRLIIALALLCLATACSEEDAGGDLAAGQHTGIADGVPADGPGDPAATPPAGDGTDTPGAGAIDGVGGTDSVGETPQPGADGGPSGQETPGGSGAGDDGPSGQETPGGSGADGTGGGADDNGPATPADPGCEPCFADTDCDDDRVCREVPDTGRWACLTRCDAGSAVCPEATTCDDIAGALLCVPDENDCACATPADETEGKCLTEGVCEGAWTCAADGPSVCDAKPPTDEICNGKDDDCDGEVDEDATASCDDENLCTKELCVDGQCKYAASTKACLIAGNCWPAGTVKPNDDCAACDPDASTSGWSPRSDGTPCSDGDACTVSDACQDGGCVGAQNGCDDGNPCTVDSCVAATGCTHTPLEDGAFGGGATPCDDGDACTFGDMCQLGPGGSAECVGVALDCDDGVPCTVDTCGDGVCDSALSPEWCLIDGACHGATASSAKNACMICDPTVAQGQWTAREDGAACEDDDLCTTAETCTSGVCTVEAVSCQDGNDCTLDFCVSMVGCLHQPVSGLFCKDDDPCTIAEVCAGAVCVGGGTLECDDGSICTADSCEAGVGCVTSPVPGGCDDGDECTTDDACTDGICQGAALPCDDGLNCTVDGCEQGVCTHEIAEETCLIDGVCYATDDPDPTNDCRRCNFAAASDAFTNLPAGAACDDGDGCTVGEQCQGGGCVGGTAAMCDDGNSCTDDACDPAIGCTHTPNANPCSDGDFCTVGDVCQLGACSGAPRDCSVQDGSCTTGVCDSDESACVAMPVADGTKCDDGRPCSGPDACVEGQCMGPAQTACCASDPDCDDGNSCTVDSCDNEGGCQYDVTTLSGTGCDDGQYCTVGDKCDDGVCGGQPRSCAGDDCNISACDEAADTCQLYAKADGADCTDDGNPCTTDACQGRACLHAPNTSACDDGVDCTFNDTCAAGACTGTGYDCDDGQACTADTCLGDGTCDNQATGDTCLIGGACYASGATNPTNGCQRCDPGAPYLWSNAADGAVCADDGDLCTDDVCQAGACAHPFNTQPCDDGVDCTANDACAAGACTGAPYVCDDGVACTADACDGDGGCTTTLTAGFCLIGGSCFADLMPSPSNGCALCDTAQSADSWSARPDGFSCDDDSACTSSDTCLGGVCGGAAVDCDDANACTDDSCEAAAGCVNTPNTLPCSDGAFCTVSDVCQGGACLGTPRDCGASGDACNDGLCDEDQDACVAAPVSDGTPCDDGGLCTENDACQAGACVGSPVAGCCSVDSDCDDGNPCTLDTCTPSTGDCSHDAASQDGQSCSDGQFCTVGDTCAAGLCGGGARDCSHLDTACAVGLCDEALSACVADPANESQTCADDGNACTDDLCQGGVCAHPTNTAPCDDGNDCTSADQCNAGSCVGSSYVCDDGLSCTTDVCDGLGGCSAPIDAGACVISGACVDGGGLNPAQVCEACDPATSQSAWTVRPDGTGCDDADLCTSADQCTAGVCAGSSYACDDGLACTADACDGLGGCTATITSGCLIGGVCYADGASNPANACEVCAPATSDSDWSQRTGGTPCDDGSACTTGDACSAGVCVGSPVDCDDANACTDDACDPATGCSNTPNTSPCSDGLYCTVNDVCDAGACAGSARDCSGAGSECATGVCDEDLDSCVAQPMADGTPCDDGSVCTGPDLCVAGACEGAAIVGCCTSDADCDDANACTADTCDPGTGICQNDGSAMDGSGCDDGLYCTTGDVCGSGACGGSPRDCSALDGTCTVGTCNESAGACEADPANEGGACTDDGDACTDDVCQGGSCAHPFNTSPCDDGDDCTFSDTCNSGSCTGTSYACDDGLSCTADACDGLGGCTATIAGDACVIGGTCWATGEHNPAESCEYCSPGATQTAWTLVGDGGACDDGNACTTFDTCSAGVCVGGPSICNPCTTQDAGTTCDDGNPLTHGDFCMQQACAGFFVTLSEPDNDPGSELVGVTYTAGDFHAVGMDDTNGWIARIEGIGTPKVLAEEGDDFTWISNRVAVTDDGDIFVWNGSKWDEDDTLENKLNALSGSPKTIASVWAPQGSGDLQMHLTGRDGGDAWVARCTTDFSGNRSCSLDTVNANYFEDETPWAIGGWSNGSTARLLLLADYPVSSKWANDAFLLTSLSDTTWDNTYYDSGPSSQQSRDVTVTSATDAWLSGTNGLLRVRRSGGWTFLHSVLSSQSTYDMNGLWADDEVVLIAADNGAAALSLVTHDVTTADNNGANWNVIDLTDAVTDCKGDSCARTASFFDVWAEGDRVVIVGWAQDSKGNKKALHLFRNPTVKMAVVP